MDLRRLYAVLLDGRSWRLVGWQLLSFPGDLFWGVLVWVLYSVGAGLVVVWVGILVLVGAQVLMRSVAALEVRTLAAVVGDPPLPIAPRRPSSQPGLRGTVLARLADATAWRCALWNASRLVLGPLAFTTALAAVVSPVAVVGGLVVAIVALSDGWYGPGQSLDGLLVVVWSALLVVAGVPGLWWLTRGVAWLQVALVRWAVSPSARSQLAAQEQRAERAEERVRIDQELHDSIGHMITMNTVQAGAGAYVFDTDPEFARQALRTIEERGRAAMGELDRIIATVRGADPSERVPLPGLADLPDLVARSAEAGLEVHAEIDPPKVSAGVGRAVFAIVREALTNAARHAPGAQVRVTVVADGDGVGVEVQNSATAGPPVPDRTPRAGAGLGLAGIRDRAVLLGGRASAGPTDGGFVVRALLPTGTSLAAPDPGRPSRWDDLRGTVAR